MAITLSTIASRCNLSRQTVSQIIRNPENPKFAERTRKLVLTTARNLNYLPNRVAGHLREGRTQLLSMVVAWYAPELMDLAEQTASAREYALMVQCTAGPNKEAEIRALTTALTRRVDGIVWQPLQEESAYEDIIRQIRRMGVQVVMLETQLESFWEASVVDFDYSTGYGPALEHLEDQGYRKLVYLTGLENRLDANQINEFHRAVSGVPAAKDVCIIRDEQEIQPAVLRQLEETPVPVCFVCETDWLGLHVIRIAKALRLNVPQQLGVIVINDVLIGGRFRVGELCTPSISAIPRPFGQMSRRAIEILVERIEKKTAESGRKELIPMSFIPRESTTRRV